MPHKKILLSLFIIGIVSFMAVSTTFGYFEDIELSEDNNLTAGILDLYLDSATAPYTTAVAFPDGILPGNNGSTYQSIENVGSLRGRLNITLEDLQNIESTASGLNLFLGDDLNGPGVGELGEVAEMAIWVDLDHNNTFNSGDISLKANGDKATDNNGGDYYFSTINSYFGENGSRTWSNITEMNSGNEYYVHILWKLPLIHLLLLNVQGDSVKFDIVYTLDQQQIDS